MTKRNILYNGMALLCRSPNCIAHSALTFKTSKLSGGVSAPRKGDGRVGELVLKLLMQTANVISNMMSRTRTTDLFSS